MRHSINETQPSLKDEGCVYIFPGVGTDSRQSIDQEDKLIVVDFTIVVEIKDLEDEGHFGLFCTATTPC